MGRRPLRALIGMGDIPRGMGKISRGPRDAAIREIARGHAGNVARPSCWRRVSAARPSRPGSRAERSSSATGRLCPRPGPPGPAGPDRRRRPRRRPGRRRQPRLRRVALGVSAPLRPGPGDQPHPQGIAAHATSSPIDARRYSHATSPTNAPSPPPAPPAPPWTSRPASPPTTQPAGQRSTPRAAT